MSKKMIYNFTVPVRGFEHFSVVAESYEEALDKIHSGDYFIEPSPDDIDWDFGFRAYEEELPKCYTLEECDERSSEQDKIQALEMENKTLKAKLKSLGAKCDDLKLRMGKLDK